MNFVLLTNQATSPPTRAGQLIIFADSNGALKIINPNGSLTAIGVGIPSGGGSGQVLKKVDGADFNVTWGDDLTGAGGGSVSWGSITGTLSNQTDLNSSLNGKAAASHTHGFSDLSGVAASGHDQAQTLTSGTYTPTLTSVANVAAKSASACSYARVGSTVMVWGKADVTDTSAGVVTQLGISLPVSSNVSTLTDVRGLSVMQNSNNYDGRIYADTTNHRAQAEWTAQNNVSLEHWFSFAYQVN